MDVHLEELSYHIQQAKEPLKITLLIAASYLIYHISTKKLHLHHFKWLMKSYESKPPTDPLIRNFVLSLF